MSDKRSAHVFSTVFSLLAENVNDQTKEIAHKLWHETYPYDFSLDQMECDKELVLLGLARPATPEEEEEHGRYVYLEVVPPKRLR